MDTLHGAIFGLQKLAEINTVSIFFLVIFSLILPRLTLLFIGALTDWISFYYDSLFFPIVGWFLAPYTTLSYLAVMAVKGRIGGVWVLLLCFSIFLDAFHFQNTSIEFSRKKGQ